MIVFVFNHPVGCAVGLIVAFYAVAVGSYFWPSHGETNDRRHRDTA